MKTFSRFLLSAGFALAIASTFSCSGDDGKDGRTPEISIGANGNWFIDGTDTGVNAQGKDGTDGKPGSDGKPGEGGAPCTVEKTDLGVEITCGGDVVLIPHYCGSETYNPSAQFCDAGKGAAYKFAQIGGQTWMAEDLKGGADNKFTWEEANEACPAGWSLPGKDGFDALALILNDSENADAEKWNGTGSWWSGDEFKEDDSEAYRLQIGTSKVANVNSTGKAIPLAVRCLKD